MKRSIITIDEDKCNGCGVCITACHEGAIALVDGKAKLVSETYCDGLGACLPGCPTGAIVIEEREAEGFDEEAVKRHLAARDGEAKHGEGHHGGHGHGHHEGHGRRGDRALRGAVLEDLPCGCPGSQAKTIGRSAEAPASRSAAAVPSPAPAPAAEAPVSQLQQWPVQIKLVPPSAPYLHRAHLLIAADCAAYARANFHEEFIKGRITLIGCPKLDEGDYSDKLAAILAANDVKSVTVVRMEVPCCGGLVHAVKQAMLKSGTMVPWSVVTVGTDGSILD